jgi:hypothetical protein
MALSAAQATEAEARAIEYLEYSTYSLSLMLGVDLTDVSGSWVIPVAAGHDEYNAHDCLKKQVVVLTALKA